jgi:polyvinyl alcohol dehydrogenase (cytochrome)
VKTRLTLLALGTAAAAVLVPLADAATTRGCAKGTAGGEWRSYGHDLSNTRNQPGEKAITAANAANLTPKWVFNNNGGGEYNGTPVVADGCVFVGDASGYVSAINADTGQLVYKAPVFGPVSSTVAVAGGRVFVTVNQHAAPYLAALDERTGELLWRTQMAKQFGIEGLSSPTVFDGMVMAGVSGASAEAGTTICPPPGPEVFGCGGGADSRLRFRGIYVILDAATGKLLHRGHTINDRDFKEGYAGGGIWSTAAVDTRTKHAFFGTGNPFSASEHKNTNSIIKIDLNRKHRTFGEIVGVYHGTQDLYLEGSAGTFKPVCAIYVDVFTCDPPDWDFGASPQLITLDGKRYVGAMQKSSDYHLADTATMKRKWRTQVSGPTVMIGGMATATFDGKNVFTGGSHPGLTMSLAPRTGGVNWVAPIADGVHFQSLSSAGGVVYVVDSKGFFNAWDASSGLQLLARPLSLDTGEAGYAPFSAAPSVSIARHTVYVTASGNVIAYKP